MLAGTCIDHVTWISPAQTSAKAAVTPNLMQQTPPKSNQFLLVTHRTALKNISSKFVSNILSYPDKGNSKLNTHRPNCITSLLAGRNNIHQASSHSTQYTTNTWHMAGIHINIQQIPCMTILDPLLSKNLRAAWKRKSLSLTSRVTHLCNIPRQDVLPCWLRSF